MSTQTEPPTSTPPAIPPRPGAPQEEFFARIRALGVVRPDQGRWAAGVAAGLAHRWGVDPILIRGAFVALSLVGGSGVALYGLCWLFLPHPDGRIHAQEAAAGRFTPGVVGSGLLVLLNLGGLFGIADAPGYWRPFSAVPLVVLGLLAWWWYSSGRRLPGSGTPFPGASAAAGATTPTGVSVPAGTTPSTAFEPGSGSSDPIGAAAGSPVAVRPPDPQRPLHWLTLLTLGVALLAGAGAGYARYVAVGSGLSTALVGTGVALGVVALGALVAGVLGRRAGGLAPVAVLLAVVCLSGTFWNGRGPIGFGDRTWAPTAAAQVPADGFQQGAGTVVLDLTAPGLLTGASTTAPLRVPVRLGAGQVRILVPAGVSVRVDGTVGLGEIDDRISGRTDSGGGNDLTMTSGTGDPVLVVRAEVGVGQLEVTR